MAGAGNSGDQNIVYAPARYDTVIAVGATDQNNVRASFSWVLLGLIPTGLALWGLQTTDAHASDVRNFADKQELESWLEQDYQTVTYIWLRPQISPCVDYANAMMKRLAKDGFASEQYTILSSYYFHQHYPPDCGWSDGGHAVIQVKAGEDYYLVEPTNRMAWQWHEDQGYVGEVSDW